MEMHGTDDAWAMASNKSHNREELRKLKEQLNEIKDKYLYIPDEAEIKPLFPSLLNECVKLFYVIEKSREELESLYGKRAFIHDKHWSDVMLEIQREKKYGGCVSEEALEEVKRREKETLDSNGLTKEIESLEKLVNSYKEARTHLIDDIVKEML